MHVLGLPVGFFVALVAYILSSGPIVPKWDAVEFFAGEARWAAELRKIGLSVATMDIQHGQQQDFMSPEGFVFAAKLLLECKPGAVAHWATVCSSWVPINFHTSGRTTQAPLGKWRQRMYVAEANVMVSRTGLLMLLGICLATRFILEQPRASLMPWHPRLEQIFHLAQCGGIHAVEHISTFMGSFGAPTPKPTILIGNVPWLCQLKRKLNRSEFTPNEDVVRYHIDQCGRKRFSGGKKLKETQKYPSGYGFATASIILDAPIEIDPDEDGFNFTILENEGEWYRTSGAEHWLDAELGKVWKLLYTKHVK